MVTKFVSAQSKGSAARAKYSGNNWQQAEFIQRELTPSEQTACKEWDFSESAAFDQISRLNEAGYKVTLRWDDYNTAYAAWVLPPVDHADNSGLILTGRGSTAHKAFKQAFYKHAVLFSEVWPRGGDRRGVEEIND